MAIPLATTTITITRPAVADDPYDGAETTTTVAAGVRAHISTPSGREQRAGGSQETIDFRLNCDTVDLRHGDRVTDAQAEAYEVVWAQARVGLGLDHVEAGLRQAGAAV